LHLIPSDENSCRNRFFPSQKWELAPQMIFWIGRGALSASCEFAQTKFNVVFARVVIGVTSKVPSTNCQVNCKSRLTFANLIAFFD